MEKDQEFLETILKGIVEKADEIKVNRTVDSMGVLLEINIAQTDVGAVIGREGKTIQAIRVIMNIIGRKNQSNINVKVNADRPEQQN